MSNEIAGAFGIDTPTEYPMAPITVDEVEAKTKALQTQVSENIDKDYKYVRKNLIEMIDSTMTMIPNLVDLVQQSESARMYESAAAFMKMIADLNKDLIGSSKELQKDAPVKAVAASTNPDAPAGDTNIFIGTAGDIFSRLSKPKVVDAIEELPVINDK